MKRKLNLYVISEILPPFLLGVLVFTSIPLILNIVKLIKLVVSHGVPLTEIGKLLGLALPAFLEVTMPMSLLFGILLGLTRLSSDQEVLALKASGISPLHILFPVAGIGAIVALLTLAITAWLRPAATLSLQRELYEVAKSRVETTLRENVFNNDFPKVLIYVEEAVPLGNTFRGMLIVDQRDPARTMIIFGKVAFFLPNEDAQTLSLKLFDGTIHERRKGSSDFAQTHFNVYDFRFDFEDAFNLGRQKGPDPKEMPLEQLIQQIEAKQRQGQQATTERLEFHRRFSFPFVPLIFSVLGVALGVLPTGPRAGRFWGFTVCAFCLLIHYGLLSLCRALGQQELEFFPPWFALWLPNILIGLFSLYLFTLALSESPPSLQLKLKELYWIRKFANPDPGKS